MYLLANLIFLLFSSYLSIFMCISGSWIKKKLDGKVKISIHSKNVHKNVCTQLRPNYNGNTFTVYISR